MNKNLILGSVFILCLGACGTEVKDDHAGHDHGETKKTAEVEMPSNRTPIPATVRQNLGITFATATYRAVNKTVVVPGSFELKPGAQHHYPLPLAGRVTIHVKPLQSVKQGELIMSIEAPDWKELQMRLAESDSSITQSKTLLLKANANQAASIDIFADMEVVKKSIGKQNDVYQADVDAAIVSLKAQELIYGRLIAKASVLTGLTVEELKVKKGDVPNWLALETILIRASHDGIVKEISVASGAWQEAGAEIVHAVHPNQLRFHGRALQADLDKLQDGQSVSIRPPMGHRTSYDDVMKGKLHIGVSGNVDARLIDIYVDIDENEKSTWARPQVAVMAEVSVAGSPNDEQLAIPLRGVITDGLDKIVFRRDPKDVDLVIRMKADLGTSDGEWVVVESGIAEGDEVVIGGIYELKLATTGQKTTAGHFHSDGTFHDGED